MSEIEKKEDSSSAVGRNEPCPCGSGKKYKRCHGIDAAPKLSMPAAWPPPGGDLASSGGAAPGMPGMGMGGMPPGMGMPGGGMPNLDPAMMAQVTQALQRLPRGQLQRLQSIMQKAMSGKDVTREAAEFERTLPPDFQQLMTSMAATLPGMGGMGMPGAAPAEQAMLAPEPAAAPAPDLSIEEAKKIIEKAAAEGKISKEQAESLLAVQTSSSGSSSNEEIIDVEPISESSHEASEGKGEEPGKKGLGKFWGKFTGK